MRRWTGDEIEARDDLYALNSMLNVTPGGGPVITQQHFADEVDIKTIVARFGLTGVLPQRVAEGVYGDFSGISDYESAVATIARTQERFMTLPAELREKFENDPGELVRFAASHSEAELADFFGEGARPLDPPKAAVAGVEPAASPA